MNPIALPQLNRLCFCLFIVFAASLFFKTGFAQTTVSGRVVDSLTQEPLGAASIFFANESKSAASLPDGTFKLTAVGPGKHILIISYVGYKSFVKTLLIEASTPKTITANLQPATQSLTDVVVGVPLSPKKRALLLNQFTKAFFGNSENASKCKLLTLKF